MTPMISGRVPGLRLAGALFAAVLASAAGAVPVFAQPADSAPPAAAPSDPAASFAADLDAFVRAKMAERLVPGVAVVVVRDGEVAVLRGYGLADVGRGVPVDPERTVFRCGSVSKLFTATAAMQMVERGRIDLRADVNVYLKRFKVPDAFGRPVTMDALLTHTSGLSEFVAGQHKVELASWRPLGDYLARRLPRRVLPPGETFIYSDHGMSLAGLVVEEAAGVPFARFVEENVFAPLGMTRSTFEVAPPPAIAEALATGYIPAGAVQRPYPYDYVETVPAAGLLSTAGDVARFMLAHLAAETPGGSPLLRPETAADMHRRHFAHDPRLERGRAYGFSEMDANGVRAIFHDGGMPGFNCRLVLVPGRNLGFFAVWNSDRMGMKYDLTTWLFDRLVPKAASAAAAPVPAGSVASSSAAATDPSEYRGFYRENEGLSVTMLKIGRLAEGVPVVPGRGGSLRAFGTDFLPLGNDAFRTADGMTMVFRRGRGGRVVRMFAGTGAFDRARWFETPTFHYGLMGILAAVLVPAGLAWPLVRLLKRRGDRPRRMPRGMAAAAPAAVLALVFLAAMFLLIAGMDGYWPIMKSQPPWSTAVKFLVLPLLVLPLAVLAIASAARAWRRREGSLVGRLAYSTVALALLAFLWFCSYWNLLGFRY